MIICILSSTRKNIIWLSVCLALTQYSDCFVPRSDVLHQTAKFRTTRQPSLRRLCLRRGEYIQPLFQAIAIMQPMFPVCHRQVYRLYRFFYSLLSHLPKFRFYFFKPFVCFENELSTIAIAVVNTRVHGMHKFFSTAFLS